MTTKNTLLSTTVSIIAILGLSTVMSGAQQAAPEQENKIKPAEMKEVALEENTIELDKAAKEAAAVEPAAGAMEEKAIESSEDDAYEAPEDAPKPAVTPPM